MNIRTILGVDYESPVCTFVEAFSEGVFCGSGEDASFTNEKFENITYNQGAWV